MVPSLEWTALAFWAVLPALVRGALEKRSGNATTGAVCFSTYSWMNNKNSQSPCLLAAVLNAPCGPDGNWYIQALTPGYQYAYPNSSNANYCACSWAVYNLLAACTVCQDYSSIDNWSTYKTGCGEYATSTYFPNSITVSNNTLLPYWAATDPSTWPNAIFNSSVALSIYSQGKSDINLSASTQSSSSNSSSSTSPNAGAIAGGVVGGLAVVVAGLVALFFYCRRRERSKSRKPALLDPLPNGIIHGRSLSDTSQMTSRITDPVGFSPDFRPMAPLNMYTSSGSIASPPRSHAASSSVNSLPYDVSLISGPAFTSPTPPPPPPSQQPTFSSQASVSGGQPHTFQNVIEPYTLTSSNQDLSSTDRKRAEGNLYPIYEQQIEYPGEGPFSNPPVAARRRMNPPAYTESATSGESSVVRSVTPPSVDLKGRGHGSSDTVDSSMTPESGTEPSWSPVPRRGDLVRESVLSRFTGITGLGSDVGPSSVVGVGSAAAISNATDSQTRLNLMSAAGSVVGGDDIA